MYFPLVSPLDKNPDPKYKPYHHLEKHDELIFFCDVQAVQASLLPNVKP